MNSNSLPPINTVGLISGIIAWILIMWYATTQSECLRMDSCGAGSLILFAIIGLGMLAPAWLVALFVTTMTEKQ